MADKKKDTGKKGGAKKRAAKIADDSVWILGTAMTPFGRYPE